MLRKSYDVFCDQCGVWVHGVVIEGGDGSTLARRAARANGWRRLPIDGELQDLCPECARPHLTPAQLNNDANTRAAAALSAPLAVRPQPRLGSVEGE